MDFGIINNKVAINQLRTLFRKLYQSMTRIYIKTY